MMNSLFADFPFPCRFLVPQGLSSVFDDTQVLWYLIFLWVRQSSQRLGKKVSWNESSHRIWKDIEVSANWIQGVRVPAPVALLFFFSTSPFSITNGFGEDIVSPIQIHDPVLQVEFPFVLTPVNLGSKEKEMNVVGVKVRWFYLSVDAVSNACNHCNTVLLFTSVTSTSL